MLAYDKIVDLTHTLSPTFPTFEGWRAMQFEPVRRIDGEGYSVNHWSLEEHVGTHLDAPCHMNPDGLAADEIPVKNFIGPLAVVDMRSKAENNDDAVLTADDLQAWERDYGPLPQDGVVALLSGWDQYVHDLKYRNADTRGHLHFPSFDLSAVEYLLAHTTIKGLLIDTLSIDVGDTHTYPVHLLWLGANRWAVECVANLSEVPPVGATVIVGVPKVRASSGAPCRVMALVP